jgi:hypothetical protein
MADLAGPGDYEGSAPTLHSNDPRNADPSDAELSADYALIAAYFRKNGCYECPHRSAMREVCMVVEDGLDLYDCPEWSSIWQDAMHAAQEEYEAGYP